MSINNTFSLRKTRGQMVIVDSVSSQEHVDFCEACGSTKPEKLFPVSGGGWSGMVGSTCAGILTSNKNPHVDSVLLDSGETYQDGDKSYIYPTLEWKKSLGDYLYQEGEHKGKFGGIVVSNYETNYNGAYRTINHNSFLDSVYQQARKNGKISIKQFDAVNKSIKSN